MAEIKLKDAKSVFKLCIEGDIVDDLVVENGHSITWSQPHGDNNRCNLLFACENNNDLMDFLDSEEILELHIEREHGKSLSFYDLDGDYFEEGDSLFFEGRASMKK